MSEFWKTASLILITTILSLSVGKTEQDISVVLGMVALCIGTCAAVTILEPVLDYLRELQNTFRLPEDLINVLLKAVGITLAAELSAAVCSDAGNTSLAKTLQILGGAVVLSLSVPVFRTLMLIIKEMIGSV